MSLRHLTSLRFPIHATHAFAGGDLTPSAGAISINGHSVVAHTQAARLALGVCPQFTAVDAQLNVREHLALYAALKGVPRHAPDVVRVLAATGLAPYAERLANTLSGGNQRKLALAIALLGECLIFARSGC